MKSLFPITGRSFQHAATRLLRSRTAAALALAFCGAALTVVAAPAAGTVALHGHVPAVIAHLQPQGSLPAAAPMSLSIGLPLRNRGALAGLLEEVCNPASPNFRHYLTPDQFSRQFGPTEEDYQKVIQFARRNGLNVVATHSNRMLLDVSGSAANVEKAFNIRLQLYRHPTENRLFFAPDSEPSVPAGLPVLDIGGLDNYRRPHPQIKFKPGVSTSPTPSAATGSGPFGNYIGDDFRRAYVPGAPDLTGAGQAVALVQFDGYLASDITAYENLAGRTNVPLQNVLIDGFSGLPTGNGGEVEVSLDIEMAVSMAPALAKVIVYEGDPYNFHPNDVLNRIAMDDLARQISCSWGWTGGPSATTDQILQEMAVQGQTFFTASGDGDAYPAGSVDSPFNFGTPSDSPYLTSVGGTTLTMFGSGGVYAREVVWNWGNRYGSVADGIGSSGGFSSFYPIPSWQTNAQAAARGGSDSFRNFPDVSLTADDVLVIADGGLEYIGVGGTSCAAPLWAGFTALANQQAALTGHGAIGFANPAFYNIANSPNYPTCFHDIRVGNNRWSGSPGLFDATNNYDLCTGLGTPNGTNLINALVFLGNSFTHLSPPPPPYGTNFAAVYGADPNGSWMLFVQDDKALDAGVISNGWVLTLTTADVVGQSADLALTMGASTSNILAEGNVLYTITVTNWGPSTCSNAVVSDTLPTGTTLVSSSATRGTVARSGATVIWSLGTLATNTGGQLTLTVQGSAAGNSVNYAVASATTPDPNPDDDSATAAISISTPQPPQFTAISATANGSIQFAISNNASSPTIIQATTNLSNANWVNVYTGTPPFLFTDPAATNYPNRYYRALLAP